jgi:hypothetical protein
MNIICELLCFSQRNFVICGTSIYHLVQVVYLELCSSLVQEAENALKSLNDQFIFL